jgi:hypothetical protein
MDENSKTKNDEILLLLINKQIDKIIATNQARDCYFSIRQNFDIEQSLEDV